MDKKDISSRQDVYLVVSEFYNKVRSDAVLAPFFNETITNWETHLDHLTTFWESSLFMTKKLDKRYSGNPLEAHIKVDKQFNHTISQEHFGRWLNLWFETLDALFEGEITENAKRRARKMSTFMYLNIFQERSK